MVANKPAKLKSSVESVIAQIYDISAVMRGKRGAVRWIRAASGGDALPAARKASCPRTGNRSNADQYNAYVTYRSGVQIASRADPVTPTVMKCFVTSSTGLQVGAWGSTINR
jgi:hypothetical protein